LDAPIYVLDVDANTLTPVERLTQWINVDTFQGATTRLVEVMTLNGLDAFLMDLSKASDYVANKLPRSVRTIMHAVAITQREQWGSVRRGHGQP
jgi:hypothetical protein